MLNTWRQRREGLLAAGLGGMTHREAAIHACQVEVLLRIPNGYVALEHNGT